jgi:predicted ribosomally synthesized peptide with nif11-like leader
MSKSEIDRFSNDVKKNASLEAEVKAKGTQIPELLTIAKAHGYDFTANDVKDYIRSQNQELTDEQIESVVGGVKSEPGEPEPPVVIMISPIINPFGR